MTPSMSTVLNELKSLALFMTTAVAVLFAGVAVESGSLGLAALAAVVAAVALVLEGLTTDPLQLGGGSGDD